MTGRSWPPADARRALRHAFLQRRRGLRAALVAIAVAAALGVVAPSPPPTRPVVVAAHDVAAGQVLTSQDVRLEPYAHEQIPAGTYSSTDAVVGRTVAGPLRRAEPVTDARMAGASALVASTGLVAAPVRLADAGAAQLLRAGDLVDVLAAVPDQAATDLATAAQPVAAGDGMATVVAASARVLDAPGGTAGFGAEGGSGVGADGALVLLAVTPATARVLAAAAATSRLSVVIRAGGRAP